MVRDTQKDRVRKRLEVRSRDLLEDAKHFALAAVTELNDDRQEDVVNARAFKIAADIVKQEAQEL